MVSLAVHSVQQRIGSYGQDQEALYNTKNLGNDLNTVCEGQQLQKDKT